MKREHLAHNWIIQALYIFVLYKWPFNDKTFTARFIVTHTLVYREFSLLWPVRILSIDTRSICMGRALASKCMKFLGIQYNNITRSLRAIYTPLVQLRDYYMQFLKFLFFFFFFFLSQLLASPRVAHYYKVNKPIKAGIIFQCICAGSEIAGY